MTTEVAYSTRERMYVLALRREAFKGVPTADQDAHLLVASSKVNLYLVRFKPPLVLPVPLEIERITCIVAAYRIQRTGLLDPAYTATLKDDHDEAIKLLELIRDGKLGLEQLATDQTPDVIESGATGWSNAPSEREGDCEVIP